MKRVAFTFILILLLAGSSVAPLKAQCAMCTINAEQGTKNGNTQGKGLNAGVIYLLVIPYLMISGIGLLWYVKYRKKSAGYVRNI